MRCLMVGDVVARPGRRALKHGLRALRPELRPDLTVVNGENAARGNGITPTNAEEIFRAGADVITTGNHVWDRREVWDYLENEPRLIRPANYPEPAPGSGIFVTEVPGYGPIATINIMGRLFMSDVSDPFACIDDILREIKNEARCIIVDFHGETTSEKAAFATHVDGRVSAVVGTHTHIPTADERILPGGTAFITDLGMTGVYDSVIGVQKEIALERFRTQRPVRFEPAEGDASLCGVIIEIDPERGLARSIERVRWPQAAVR